VGTSLQTALSAEGKWLIPLEGKTRNRREGEGYSGEEKENVGCYRARGK
jgi:hypothetical protein